MNLLQLVASVLNDKQDPLLLEQQRATWLSVSAEKIGASREYVLSMHHRAAWWARASLLLLSLSTIAVFACLLDGLTLERVPSWGVELAASAVTLSAVAWRVARMRESGLFRFVRALRPLATSATDCDRAQHLVNSEAVAHAHRDDVLSRRRQFYRLDLDLMERVSHLARERRIGWALHGGTGRLPYSLTFAMS